MVTTNSNHIATTRHSSTSLSTTRRATSSSTSSSTRSTSTTTMSKTNQQQQQEQQDHNYCVDLVRNRDREAYLCGLLMPSSARKSYFAVRAFNVELASINSSSSRSSSSSTNVMEGRGGGGINSNQLALQIRFRWWRDALDQIYNTSSTSSASSNSTTTTSTTSTSTVQTLLSLSTSYDQNPIVRSLERAIREHDLTKRFLERLIDAREFDSIGSTSTHHPHGRILTMMDAIQYAEETVSSLLYLSLESMGIREESADKVASNAGIGIGLTTSIRSFPFRIVYDHEISFPLELFTTTTTTTNSSRSNNNNNNNNNNNTDDDDDNNNNNNNTNSTTTTLSPHSNPFRYDTLMEYYHWQYQQEQEQEQQEQQHPPPPPPRVVLTMEEQQIVFHAIETMSNVAYEYLQQAQEQQRYIPKHGKLSLLPMIPSLHYLSKLQSQLQLIQKQQQQQQPKPPSPSSSIKTTIIIPNLNLDYNNQKQQQQKTTNKKYYQIQLLFLLGRSWLTGVI